MKGYSPSTELLNLYDTTREKPFEFMHSRSFVNINVATGWTVSQGGQFPYENVITLPIDEGDFPITMEYQPTAIIQPNANESCAPSNFPYIETTGRNRVTLYAYSIPSSTSMLPIVINLTQNGSPYGSTNASAQRSTVEQTMIQLSQNYFLVEVNNEVLTKDTTITFDVTAYKGGERVPITPPADQPEYAITNQDGDPILNPSGGTYPSVTVAAAGDESVKVTINLLKDTFIKNGVAIIQFPVQAGGVFYPRATINAIASTAILEQVDSYNLSFGTLTRSSDESFFVNGEALGINNKWVIKATKRTLNGVVSSLSSGTIKFTDTEKGVSYSKSLSNSEVVLEEELKTHPVFEANRLRIDLEIGGKVVESKSVNIVVSVFSTLIQPSVEYIVSGSTNNIRFSSFTLLEGGVIIPKYGTLTVYKNSVSEENKLISEDNVNEINYSLTESDRLQGVGSFIATFAETIGGEVTQQRVIPVVGGTGEPDVFSLIASPAVLMVPTTKEYVLTSNPSSTIRVYRNGIDVSGDFDLEITPASNASFGYSVENNVLTIDTFAAGSEQIVALTINATNNTNDNIQVIGSLQAIRQVEEEVITYFTYIRYTEDKTNSDLDTYPLTTDVVAGKSKWMGVAITTSDEAPINKSDYNWSAIAQDGLGIKSTEVSYGQSSDETEKPTSWGDLPTSLTKGSYLWTKTKITYTDGTFTEAYSVSYIAIDGLKGDPGERGPKGDEGYTPIKGVDYFDGVDGQDGKGIVSSIVRYQNHDNGTTAPTSTWTENPSPIKGKYLWTRTVTTYTEGDPVTTYSVAYQAIDGTDGTDGRGIVSTVVDYVKSTTATMPSSGWSTTRPTVNKGEYLWTRTTINYTSGSPSVAISNSYVPTDGQNGTSAYLWVRYSKDQDEESITDQSMTSDPTDAKYIGVATTSTPTAPTSHSLYTWSLIKGEQGVPGEPGNDGQTSYLHIKYSNDGGETFTDEEGETVGDWIGTYVDFIEEDSDEETDYTWNRVKGEKGDRGPAGPVLRIEAPDGLTFSKNQTKPIRLEAKLMDEDVNRISEYATEEIRWERSSSDSMGDILFASTKQGSSISIDPEFLNVPATYTCFISKIIEDNLTVNGETLTDHQSKAISVNTYSSIVYSAHVTTSLEISEEIKKIEKTLENIEKNSVTASEFKREQNRIFGSVAEVITTTADLVTRVNGVKDEVQKQVLKQEALTSELDMTSTRIRGEVKALSDKGDRQYAHLQLKSDSIETKVGKVGADLENQIEDFTQFVQNESEFRLTVQDGGGSNLIKNSAGYRMIEDEITNKYYPAFWTGSGIRDSTSTWILNNSTAKHGFQLQHALCGQRIELKPYTEYTIRFILRIPPETVNVLNLSLAAASHSSIEDELLWELEGELILTHSFTYDVFEETTVHRYEKTFTTNESPAYILVFNSEDEPNTMELADLGIYEGANVKGWQQHSGETYTLNVQVDEGGLLVYSKDKMSRTVMSPEEFSGYYNDKKVFTLNGNITEVQGLSIEKEGLHIAPIKMIRNDARKSLVIVWTGGV